MSDPRDLSDRDTVAEVDLDKRAVRGLVVALDILRAGGEGLTYAEIERRIVGAAKRAVDNPSLRFDPRELAFQAVFIAVEELHIECRRIELDERRAAREGVSTARPEIYGAKAQILAVVLAVLRDLRAHG